VVENDDSLAVPNLGRAMAALLSVLALASRAPAPSPRCISTETFDAAHEPVFTCTDPDGRKEIW
jgi:hypothetical protein